MARVHIERMELRVLLSGDLSPLSLYDPVSYAAGVDREYGNVMCIGGGDINGDGFTDMVCGGFHFYRVMLGQSDGTFNLLQAVDDQTLDDIARIVVGDFNEDGKTDLAVHNYNGVNSRFSILIGDGTGQFTNGASYVFRVGDQLRLADLNRDGHLDLVTEGYNSTHNQYRGVTILLGDGQGGFALKTIDNLGHFFSDIAVADLDADGKQDVIACDWQKNEAVILYGNKAGLGTTPERLSLPEFTGTDTINLAIADFTGDGRLDIVAIESSYNHMAMIANEGDQGGRSFSEPVWSELYTTTEERNLQWVYSFHAADMNNDGDMDLVYGDSALGEICVRLGRGDGTFVELQTWPVAFKAGTANDICVEDFDQDGLYDVAGGTTTLWFSSQAHPKCSIRGVCFNDKDGDGIQDLGEPSFISQTLYIDANRNGVFDMGEKTAYTDESGNFAFHSLAAGAYRVALATVPSGYMFSSPKSGHGDVTLAGGQNITRMRFGLFKPAKISGTIRDIFSGWKTAGLSGWRVFIDRDNDGNFDAGEPSVLTNAKGQWAFSGLPKGNYSVRVAGKTGWRAGSPSTGKLTVNLGVGAKVSNVTFWVFKKNGLYPDEILLDFIGSI